MKRRTRINYTPEQKAIIWDRYKQGDSLHDGMGLELYIKPNGAKHWRFRYYKPVTKKRTMISFGEWDIISLAEAREKRDSARELLDKGTDPQDHQKAQTEQAKAIVENTFRNIAAEWFELKKDSSCS